MILCLLFSGCVENSLWGGATGARPDELCIGAVIIVIILIVLLLVGLAKAGTKKNVVIQSPPPQQPIIIKNEGKSESERRCPECGRVIPEDAKMCPYCGKKFKSYFEEKDEPDEKKPKKRFFILPYPEHTDELGWSVGALAVAQGYIQPQFKFYVNFYHTGEKKGVVEYDMKDFQIPYVGNRWFLDHSGRYGTYPDPELRGYADGNPIAMGVRLNSCPKVINTLSIRDNLATTGILMIDNIKIYKVS